MNKTLTICPKCHSLNAIAPELALQKKAVCGKCQSNLDLHGLVTQVTADGLQRILKKAEGPVIVDFWAEWCGPCKVYGPEFQKASVENPQAVFLKINTEVDQAYSSQMGIKGIPCTIIFKNGTEVKRQSGSMNADQVRSLLKSL